MKLSIQEINTVHYIKGSYTKNQLKEIKCYLLDRLKEGHTVMVNIDELDDSNHAVIYMIQRLKKVLNNRRQLQYNNLSA